MKTKTNHAFTFLELLVVIAIIAILAGLLLPALSRTNGKAQSLICLNNSRQLQFAWQMYHEDNNDKLASNEISGGRLVAGSWAVGDPVADKSASNIQAGVLFPYVRSTDVYRCPADKSTIHNKHGGLPTTRHYSMSCYMNGKATETGLNERWVLHKASQITEPPPSQAFVFIHEAGFSMYGGFFYLPVRWTWADFPANHDNGHNLSFADGHVVHWPWRDPNTLKTFKSPVMGWNGYPAPDNCDLTRLLQATPGWWAAGGLRPANSAPR